jgi:hypothetical protein
MAKHEFSYQGEKFSLARTSLMLPHSTGEERSIADAFRACSLGVHQFDISKIKDADVRDWLQTVTRLMSTEGIEDATGEGKWVHRARGMTMDEKRELSRAVDRLANWFNRHFWVGD